MIQVTNEALNALNTMLSEEDSESNVAVRLVHRGSGNFAIERDTPKEDDVVVEHEGSPVFVVEEELANSIGDVTVDATSTDGVTQLELKRTEQPEG